MVAAPSLRPSTLQWVRTEFAVGRETFEARDGDRVVGTVHCHGLLVGSGEADTEEGRWTFKPDGILRSRLKICDGTTGELDAVYEGRALRGAVRGMLRFAGGRQLEWIKERFWGSSWQFATERGEPVVRFRDRPEQGAVSELCDAAESEPALSLLLALGFYLRRMGIEEDRAEAKREARRMKWKTQRCQVAPVAPRGSVERGHSEPPAAPRDARWDRGRG